MDGTERTDAHWSNSMTCTASKLEEFVATLPGGLLRHGRHDNSVECCVLEAISLCEGRPKTDDPTALDRPDCRALNDAAWSSNEARTRGMLMLAPLLEAWPEWSRDRRVQWAQVVALKTVREIVQPVKRANGLAAAVAARAAAASEAAAYADYAAAAATYASGTAAVAARAAADAAWAAAASEAAAYAAYAAAAAAAARAADAATDATDADAILMLACRIWAEAAA